MAKPVRWVVVAVVHAFAVVAVGYMLLGPIPMLLFASGFVGGLAIWLGRQDRADFADIRLPYFLTLAAFVLHKVEERELDFFPALSDLTGVPVPQEGSPLAVLLYLLAAAWLLVPFLMSRKNPLGAYLAWTLFASMGGLELAHFAFPLFRYGPYGYFPGMWSVILLAPAAWWGAFRMVQPPSRQPHMDRP